MVGGNDPAHNYSEVDIKEISGFLIDGIFVVFGSKIFQQTVGIPMDTNCAPLLADLFLWNRIHSKTSTWE
jgi:hypothetical protein